jgi:hypothetical protein
VVGDKQQITVAIDFHTYGELILWPYGYTYQDVPPDMTQDDHDAMAVMGRAMAAANGYYPQQSSDLYITDGTINDWLYGAHRILNYTFEMYGGAYGFYPPDEVIAAQTSRNRTAILYLIWNADCPYRTIGKAEQYCAPTTVFADDFDGAPTGWTVNPDGSDSATRGQWEIAAPDWTAFRGLKQLGAPQSGANDLVTGRLGGRRPLLDDLDGGLTTVRSAPIAISGSFSAVTLNFYSYFAHAANASNADYFRVKVIGSTTATIFEQTGDRSDVDAVWEPHSVDLTAFKGQTIRLQIECADAARESLVECGLDSLSIVGAP